MEVLREVQAEKLVAASESTLYSLDLVDCPLGNSETGVDCTVRERLYPSTLFKAEYNGGGDTSRLRSGDLVQVTRNLLIIDN